MTSFMRIVAVVLCHNTAAVDRMFHKASAYLGSDADVWKGASLLGTTPTRGPGRDTVLGVPSALGQIQRQIRRALLQNFVDGGSC